MAASSLFDGGFFIVDGGFFILMAVSSFLRRLLRFDGGFVIFDGGFFISDGGFFILMAASSFLACSSFVDGGFFFYFPGGGEVNRVNFGDGGSETPPPPLGGLRFWEYSIGVEDVAYRC
jgi:hypothetical protein